MGLGLTFGAHFTVNTLNPKPMSQQLRQHIEKIIPITDDEFEYVLSHFVVRKFKKHQFIVQEGQVVENDFFVLSGCLKSYHTDSNGKQHIIQFGMEDWWITDYQASSK